MMNLLIFGERHLRLDTPALAARLRLFRRGGVLPTPFAELLHALGAQLAQARLLLVGQEAENLAANVGPLDVDLSLNRGDILGLSPHGGFVEISLGRLSQGRLFFAQLLHQWAHRLPAMRENISEVGTLSIR